MNGCLFFFPQQYSTQKKAEDIYDLHDIETLFLDARLHDGKRLCFVYKGITKR